MQPEPKLLTDKNRLPEIYWLRVKAWEHSKNSDFVNSKLFPDGWYDELDEDGYHWIVENHEGRIIAAARLNIFNQTLDYTNYTDFQPLLSNYLPFSLYSRLVVGKDYRGLGLSGMLDTIVIKNAIHLNAKIILGISDIRTEYMVEKLGFQIYKTSLIRYSINSPLLPVDMIVKIL